MDNNQYKILVIDDDVQHRSSVTQLLMHEFEGCTVLNATNGKTGMMLIENQKPDFVISDWEMPELNGIELIRLMQSNPQLATIPIMICTGVMLDIKDLEIALENGAIDYLRKPYNETELLARIKTLLRFTRLLQEQNAQKQKIYELENQLLNEQLERQNTEVTIKALTIGKYNDLMKSVSKELRNMSKVIYAETNSIEIDNLVKRIDVSVDNENWEEFYASFETMNPTFFNDLLKRVPTLSKNELKLCALLKLNLSTKEISDITQQSVRSIEMARFRLRNKLNLNRDEQINVFLNLQE